MLNLACNHKMAPLLHSPITYENKCQDWLISVNSKTFAGFWSVSRTLQAWTFHGRNSRTTRPVRIPRTVLTASSALPGLIRQSFPEGIKENCVARSVVEIGQILFVFWCRKLTNRCLLRMISLGDGLYSLSVLWFHRCYRCCQMILGFILHSHLTAIAQRGTIFRAPE